MFHAPYYNRSLMERNMQVSFSGLKNIGYKMNVYQYAPDDKNNVEAPDCMHKDDFLNVQLIDDFNGKDRSEFNDAIKKSGASAAKYSNNKINKDFLNIALTVDEDLDDIGIKKTEYTVYLNDNELKLKDKSLPIFDYIAKLTRRIAAMNDNKFVVNNDYLESDDAATGIELGEDLRETVKTSQYGDAIEFIHSPQNVKTGSKIINDNIQKMMTKYFEG